jgi:NAD(P)-dependent dehydrogenase (short-subunit alcohol dehydrogenase family)
MSETLEIPEIGMDERLAGKTAIVTGGGSAGALAGSGAAISILFAAKGANVVIADLDTARGKNTADLIESRGGRAVVVETDVTDPSSALNVADRTVEEFGSLDILVNNAAIAPNEKDHNDELWQRVLDIDLRSAKLMADGAVPHMTRQGGGAIVNIASHAGLRAGGGIAYTAAKAGLIGLTKALAYEYGRAGIRANAVAPGHVHTPMGIGYTGWAEEINHARRLRAEAGLLGTEGTGWDVAYAALFLASEEARWITAVTIPVDAGTIEVMPLVMFPIMAAATDSGPS